MLVFKQQEWLYYLIIIRSKKKYYTMIKRIDPPGSHKTLNVYEPKIVPRNTQSKN